MHVIVSCPDCCAQRRLQHRDSDKALQSGEGKRTGSHELLMAAAERKRICVLQSSYEDVQSHTSVRTCRRTGL